ncbi:zinc finger protein DZIP1L [Lingula anatina]|uniref:Zinc finger protein DZIP1L n=1 Tax=Lingula anatina TaxID=7574 RepID=A0A2R2MRJ2_LINAN|nr:zinc finger protein DZIP1L [Lingula anatina]|eukprot:XP_023932874.1 zinc finger protein DZIP1L [Lingula anatina]
MKVNANICLIFQMMASLTAQDQRIPYSPHMNGPYSNGPVQGGGYVNSGNGRNLTFRKRFERVDWRRVAALDVDRISRELDFTALQENIMNITFCNIESEVDIRLIDANFIKLFKLAQLTIEYLLHSQDYLSDCVATLEEKLRKAVEEHDETKKEVEKQKKELVEVKKESHKRKKLLAAQQQMLQSGAGSYNKCPYCVKAFINPTFLQSHLYRKHTEQVSQFGLSQPAQPQPQQYLSQQTQSAQLAQQQNLTNGVLERELSEIRERLRLTESQLQEERNALKGFSVKEKEEWEHRERQHQQELQSLREELETDYKNRMDNMQAEFMAELKATHKELEKSRLDASQRSKPSNLGTMYDEEEIENLRKELRENEAKREEELEQFKNRDRQREEKAATERAEYERQYKEKIKQLRGQLRDVETDLSRERESKGQDMNSYQKEITELRNQSREMKQAQKEKDRLLKQREKEIQRQQQEIEQLASRPPTVAPRKPPAGERAGSPSKSPSKRAPVPQIMETPATEEEEEEEETETEESSDLKVSDLGASSKDTLGSTSGDLTMTGTSLKRLKRELVKNPAILGPMKEELRHLLDEELEKRGISPNAQGISNAQYNSKMGMLKNERQQKAKKYPTFYDIRQQYINKVDDMAKERLRGGRKGAKSGGDNASPVKRPAEPVYATPIPKKSRGGSKATPQTQQQQQPRHQASMSSKQPPKPAPRTPSPTKPSLNASNTLSSTGSQQAASSKWDSDEISEDEESEEEDEDEDIKPSQRPIGGQGQVKGQQVPPPVPAREPEVIDEDDDWDSDEISDLDEISPSHVRGTLAKTGSSPAKTGQAPQPKGSIVANLARSIESQLSGRKAKKPAGAVDLNVSGGGVTGGGGGGGGNELEVPTARDVSSPVTPDIPQMEDGEESGDTFSISSSLGESPQETKAKQKKPGKLSTHGDTDFSTNTYGTSVWGGSSSKAASTVNPGGTGKSSLVSVTDWDDDDDELGLDDL